MHALDTLRRLNDSAVVRSAVTARYALPDHLPDDLKAQMDAVTEPVNWSAEAAKCFQQVLGQIAQRKQEKNMNDVIARLRASKAKTQDDAGNAGYSAGAQWAKTAAEYLELERLDALNLEHWFDGIPMAPWTQADRFVMHVLDLNPDEMHRDDIEELIERFWLQVGTSREAIENAAFGESFIEEFARGACDVFAKVADQI